MSATLQPTTPTAPTAVATATTLLSTMAALTGVGNDFNQGSQLRTQAESLGAVIETEGVSVQATVLQTLAYGAMSLFGITPSGATFATGAVTFATALPLGSAPPSPQAIAIPAGTLVQSQGGVQFATASAITLPSGAISTTTGAIALASGAVGNIASGAIYGLPLTSLGYPLFVTNQAPMQGGANAEPISVTMSRFSAAVAALGLCSPVAEANALIGFTVTGTGEVVQFASCVEPWLLAGTGAGSGTPGFTVYIDNGTGGASTTLLAGALAYLMGSVTLNQTGYRAAGMPFGVSGVQPVYAAVVVSGLLVPGIVPSSLVASAVASGLSAYFGGLGFFIPAQQPQVAGVVADAGLGLFQSLAVSLYYSGGSTPVTVVSGTTAGWRVLLQSMSVSIGP